MPKVSKRGESIIESPIRSLIPSAREAKRNGKKIYHLNIGQPDIPTPQEALDAIRNHQNTIIKYGPSEGFLSLRKTVARYYDKFDGEVNYQNIYITTGASEAILFTLMACCDLHGEIIIPEPFYANYFGFASMAHLQIKPVTTELKNGFALPGVGDFERLITDKTNAILLCNPGNPTGQLYSASELELLVDLAVERDIFLIVDEVYREFCYDKAFTSVLSFAKGKEHVVVIDSISKIFSACGARVGSIATKNSRILDVLNKYAQLRLCPPHYGQILAEVCYQYMELYISEVKVEYKKRREILYQELSSIAGTTHYKPDAAFYNMVELPVNDAQDFCKWLLTEFSWEGSSVMLAPASGFYYHSAHGKRQVRIAYILNETDLKKAVACIKHGLEAYSETVEKSRIMQ